MWHIKHSSLHIRQCAYVQPWSSGGVGLHQFDMPDGKNSACSAGNV